jgi:SAM-dependent methyltransferase
VSGILFTGERLHEGDALFGVDLARHRAAYEYARSRIGAGGAGRVLDLGCGSGYGTASLACAGALVVGVDRVVPDAASRSSAAHFLRADIAALPLARGAFDLVASFQVIEHLEDPAPYLDAIAGFLGPGGTALLTTPNRLTSDRVNPYHVHEYRADELAARLGEHFHEVELCGVGMSAPVRAYMEARSRRIRRIVRLDPLRLRERLPRALVERLFALFARVVRRQTAAAQGAPEASWRDFPISMGPPADDCIDLLAVCRQPRA